MKKIIIVDDDAGILEVLKIILEENGFEVLSLSSPAKLASEMKSFQPDLIMLDIWISGFDGIEVCKKLKTNLQTVATPIILLSAMRDARGRENIQKEALADDFIEKPFDMDELLNRIDKVLSA